MLVHPGLSQKCCCSSRCSVKPLRVDFQEKSGTRGAALTQHLTSTPSTLFLRVSPRIMKLPVVRYSPVGAVLET